MTRVLSLLVAFTLISCGGGEGSSASTPVVAQIARVEIQSDGLMLLGKGQSSQLTVLAYDATGNRLDGVTPTWRSSAPTSLSVDQTGRLEAVVDNGSAQITAVVGQIASPPATAVASVPVDKVTVLRDADVVSEPALIDPAGSLDTGTLFAVSLRGGVAASLSIGSVVMSNGSQPFLGKVTGLSGSTATLAAIAPLDEFPGLQVDEILDLSSAGDVVMSPGVAANFNVIGANGVFTFNQKAGTSIQAAATGRAHALAATPLSPLECAGSSGAEIKLTGMSTKVDLSKLKKNARLSGLNSKFLLQGAYEVSSTAGVELSLPAGIKVECKLTLFYLPLKATGPLAWLLGVNVPIGVKVTATASVANVEAKVQSKVVTAGSVNVGLDCTLSCTPAHDLTARTTGDPLDGTFTAQARLGYSLALNVFMEVSALDFPKWTKVPKVFLTTTKVGPKFAVETATEAFQANQSFAASYKFTVDGTVANGDEFTGEAYNDKVKSFFKNFLKVDLVGFNFAVNLLEVNSPTASVSVDSIPLKAGDPFNVLVDFVPVNLELLNEPYSIKDLRIYYADSSGVLNEIPVQFLAAVNGQLHYSIPLLATQSMIGGTVYAFMDSKADALMLHSPMKLGSKSLASLLPGTATVTLDPGFVCTHTFGGLSGTNRISPQAILNGDGKTVYIFLNTGLYYFALVLQADGSFTAPGTYDFGGLRTDGPPSNFTYEFRGINGWHSQFFRGDDQAFSASGTLTLTAFQRQANTRISGTFSTVVRNTEFFGNRDCQGTIHGSFDAPLLQQ